MSAFTALESQLGTRLAWYTQKETLLLKKKKSRNLAKYRSKNNCIELSYITHIKHN